MNERFLKELIRESNLDVYGLGKERYRWEYTVEKFAELIVRECLDIADEYDGVGSTIANRIKKHFGVE